MRFALVALSLLAASVIEAQSPPISYVASIKPNTSSDPRGLVEYSPGGRFSATAINVVSLLRTAYTIQGIQLVGAPAWFSTERYDIAAKVDDTPPPTLQIFLRTLLADRFSIAVRNETRELPTFDLVMARSDARLGPGLTKSDFDCDAYAAGPHPPPSPGRAAPPCGERINRGALWGSAVTMTQFATSLTPFVSRFTTDRTGLTGRYDMELTWTPEQLPPATAPAAGDPTGASIFTAIQEQLGLKLVTAKGPVNVLIVDHAEKPSGN